MALALLLVGCGAPSHGSRATDNLNQFELEALELNAAAQVNLVPPVDLKRVSSCTCGHLTFHFEDSTGRRLSIGNCNEWTSSLLGYKAARLFVRGSCHGDPEVVSGTWPPALPVVEPLSADEEAIVTLLGFWLRRSFTADELLHLHDMGKPCIWESHGPVQEARIVLWLGFTEPDRFLPMFLVITHDLYRLAKIGPRLRCQALGSWEVGAGIGTS
jgi:hypothetical protein